MKKEPPSPFQPVYTAGQTLTNRMEDGKVRYDLIELENLHVARMGEMEDAEESIRIIETASLQLFQRRFVLTNGLFCNSVTAKSYTRCDND